MKALYKEGDKVHHSGTGKTGVVVEAFQSDGGWRYIVRISWQYWSVPQKSLRALVAQTA